MFLRAIALPPHKPRSPHETPPSPSGDRPNHLTKKVSSDRTNTQIVAITSGFNVPLDNFLGTLTAANFI
ncbi:MAG: hypothetical protein AAF889_03810 [Cyanobacteria bacterium P01_D01_bin.73]